MYNIEEDLLIYYRAKNMHIFFSQLIGRRRANSTNLFNENLFKLYRVKSGIVGRLESERVHNMVIFSRENI